MDSLDSVIDTAGRADDIAFLRDMLSGDEIMVFSGGPDGKASAGYAFGAAGGDTMYGYGGSDTLLGEADDDALYGGGGADSLIGGGGIDSIDGGKGGDQIFGGNGSDVIIGGAAKDRIDGGSGIDYSAGGAGADTLIGGRDNDFLQGGSGGDTFLFRAKAGDDLIDDWQDGQDRIRIETSVNLGIKIDYTGADALVTFTKGNGFTDMSILIEDVANNSLQLTQQGNVFFLA